MRILDEPMNPLNTIEIHNAVVKRNHDHCCSWDLLQRPCFRVQHTSRKRETLKRINWRMWERKHNIQLNIEPAAIMIMASDGTRSIVFYTYRTFALEYGHIISWMLASVCRSSKSTISHFILYRPIFSSIQHLFIQEDATPSHAFRVHIYLHDNWSRFGIYRS